MSWEYEEVGEFKTQADVDNWARRNNIDFKDLSVAYGRRLRVSVRRGATQMSDRELRDSRRDGFF